MPQFYERLVRADGEGGWVDLPATEECETCHGDTGWRRRVCGDQWEWEDCPSCQGSGPVPSLAALALGGDTVAPLDPFGRPAGDPFRTVGDPATWAPEFWECHARVVTDDELERRTVRFAYREGDKQ